MLEKLVLAYAVTFALSAARVAGFVVVSPLPGNDAPREAKIGLVIVLAVLVTPFVSAPGSAPEIGIGLAIPAFSEMCVGLLVGLAFRFVLAAADVLGGLLSNAVGLGMPSVFNPAIGAQDTALGHILSLFGILLALAIGLHRVALAYLLESFHAVPVGSAVHLADSMPIFFELAGGAIAAGTRLAMPVIAAGVALQLVLALLARAAPTMQLFSVGFPVLLLAGLGILVTSLPAMSAGLAEHFAVLGTVLDRLLTTLSSWR